MVTFLALYVSFTYSLIYFTLQVLPMSSEKTANGAWSFNSLVVGNSILIGIYFEVLINFIDSLSTDVP